MEKLKISESICGKSLDFVFKVEAILYHFREVNNFRTLWENVKITLEVTKSLYLKKILFREEKEKIRS